jgi:hypothetical protein
MFNRENVYVCIRFYCLMVFVFADSETFFVLSFSKSQIWFYFGIHLCSKDHANEEG